MKLHALSDSFCVGNDVEGLNVGELHRAKSIALQEVADNWVPKVDLCLSDRSISGETCHSTSPLNSTGKETPNFLCCCPLLLIESPKGSWSSSAQN